jgi:DNA invertase Pin-like site-specific DNA recombinase
MASRRSTTSAPEATIAGVSRRAGAYVRLSRYVAGETSTERQEADARALAAAKGLDVVEVYSDVDLSAYKRGVVRPAYERLLEDVRTGAVDVVICWKVDRVARSLREFMRFVDVLDEHGVALVSVNESLDTSSPMGRAMLQILGVFAELESATISLRTKSAKAYGARNGRPNGGGRRPFAYTDTSFSALVPDEVELIHEARDRLLAGESLRAVAADWTRRGVRTAGGSEWSSSNLGRMLRSPHLAGKRRHNGGPITDGGWPVVFTDEEHDAVVAAAGEHRPAAVDRHLLTGLARCGVCRGNLRGKTTRRAGFQYACQSATCGRVVVSGAALEGLVERGAMVHLAKPKVRAALAARDRSDATKRILDRLEEDRTALEQLGRDHYVDRVISRDVFLAAQVDLEARIADAEAKVGPAKGGPMIEVPADPAALQAWWAAKPLDYKRVVLDALARGFTVNPVGKRTGGRFDDGRVDADWRY